MPTNYQSVNNLKVSEELLLFVNNELLKDIEIDSKEFWIKFDKIVHELAPINKDLIKVRESLQKKIDDWHKERKGQKFELDEYQNFLKKIDYLKEVGPDFKIKTKNVFA